MTTSEETEVRRMLISSFQHYGAKVDEKLIQEFMFDLSDFQFSDIVTAIATYRKNWLNSQMFSSTEIRDLIVKKEMN